MNNVLYVLLILTYCCVVTCISSLFQISRGKPLKFKRLEDFLKDSHKKHRDETRIQRAKHRPPPPMPPAKNRLAFAVRIREYVLSLTKGFWIKFLPNAFMVLITGRWHKIWDCSHTLCLFARIQWNTAFMITWSKEMLNGNDQVLLWWVCPSRRRQHVGLAGQNILYNPTVCSKSLSCCS